MSHIYRQMRLTHDYFETLLGSVAYIMGYCTSGNFQWQLTNSNTIYTNLNTCCCEYFCRSCIPFNSILKGITTTFNRKRANSYRVTFLGHPVFSLTVARYLNSRQNFTKLKYLQFWSPNVLYNIKLSCCVIATTAASQKA
jgi:hypothetical protein